MTRSSTQPRTSLPRSARFPEAPNLSLPVCVCACVRARVCASGSLITVNHFACFVRPFCRLTSLIFAPSRSRHMQIYATLLPQLLSIVTGSRPTESRACISIKSYLIAAAVQQAATKSKRRLSIYVSAWRKVSRDLWNIWLIEYSICLSDTQRKNGFIGMFSVDR